MNTENPAAQDSITNRRKLDEWFAASSFTDIKFWVSPNNNSSQEECEAELLSAICAFEAKEKAGTLNLIDASELKL